MKKLLLIASAIAIVFVSGFASPSNKVDTIAAATDSLSSIETKDSIMKVSGDVQAKVVTAEDGKSYVLHNGVSYLIVENGDPFDRDDEEFHNADFERDAESPLSDFSSGSLLCALLICFGIPAILIIVALYMTLKFFSRRNCERNALIARAIDSGYQLPDSFYVNQRNDMEADGSASKSMQRDPHKFQSGITMISAGIAISAFFLVIETPFGFIAGGIPLLLGIGQLIGYFFIPGFSSNKKQPRHNQFANHPYQTGATNGQSCPPPPPSEQFYYDPRDPRFNGNR